MQAKENAHGMICCTKEIIFMVFYRRSVLIMRSAYSKVLENEYSFSEGVLL